MKTFFRWLGYSMVMAMIAGGDVVRMANIILAALLFFMGCAMVNKLVSLEREHPAVEDKPQDLRRAGNVVNIRRR